jgi:hypothetical protein
MSYPQFVKTQFNGFLFSGCQFPYKNDIIRACLQKEHISRARPKESEFTASGKECRQKTEEEFYKREG